MPVEAALQTVDGDVLKLAFEIGLQLERFQPEHFAWVTSGFGAAVLGLDRFVDNIVGLGGLLGDRWTARSRTPTLLPPLPLLLLGL